MYVGEATRPRAIFASALGALFFAACGNEVTPFPEGLEPLETNHAMFPAPSGDDAHPEGLSFVHGVGHDIAWAHAKAYLHAPPAVVWAAFRDPLVVVDRRKVSEWSVRQDVEAGFDESFLVHNIVHAFLTVEFEVTWRQSSIPAGEPDPEMVAIRFQKTWGTVFIDILRGSIVLRQGDAEGITEIELIEQIQAAQGGTDNIESYLTDLYQSVRARVHDQPLPQY